MLVLANTYNFSNAVFLRDAIIICYESIPLLTTFLYIGACCWNSLFLIVGEGQGGCWCQLTLVYSSLPISIWTQSPCNSSSVSFPSSVPFSSSASFLLLNGNLCHFLGTSKQGTVNGRRNKKWLDWWINSHVQHCIITPRVLWHDIPKSLPNVTHVPLQHVLSLLPNQQEALLQKHVFKVLLMAEGTRNG